ncbi:MAG TPA: hypothetical protein VMU83_01790 [Hanamia sp.]|nr:hypothetical protein [Hanamia sp.]
MKNIKQRLIKKSGRLEIRITEANKKRIEEKASSFGISMAEIVTNLINDIPITDRKIKDERFHAVYCLCKEINYIGNNINQITIALRQIRADKKISDGEYEMIEEQLKKYNEKRNEISELLTRNLF